MGLYEDEKIINSVVYKMTLSRMLKHRRLQKGLLPAFTCSNNNRPSFLEAKTAFKLSVSHSLPEE